MLKAGDSCSFRRRNGTYCNGIILILKIILQLLNLIVAMTKENMS